MAYKPQDFPIFTHIDKSAIDKMVLKINKLLQNISSVLDVNPPDINISHEVLLCFWIVKLHPFNHHGINSNVLNTKIALCLFTNAIYYFSEKTKRDRRISEQFINDLYYSLMYRDISKESLMVLAESFVDT